MIPVAKPVIGSEEINAVIEVLKSGMYTSGPIVKEFEREFADYIGTKYAIACNSGTAALHMVYSFIGLSKEKRFITSPMSFFATVSAGLMCDSDPIFTDVDGRCNLAPNLIEDHISDNVAAIAPVHFFGHPCEIEKIVEIGNKYNVPVVEDCAQAHGAEYNGKKVGSFGLAGCFSFFATKNITTIEGGMITTDDPGLDDFCRTVRSHGMTDRNTHELIGYNYRMSEVNAAIGREQLKKLDNLNKKRIENSLFLQENIKNDSLIIFKSSPSVKDVYFWQPLFTHLPEAFASYLKRRGIGFRHRYSHPLYRQPILRGIYDHLYLDNAEHFSGCMFGLPNYPGLSEDELKQVVEAVNEFSP